MNNDLISREALKKQLKEHYDEGFDDIKAEAIASFEHWASLVNSDTLFSHSRISALLYLALTEERPQGEWELHGMIYYCSKCGHYCGESGDNFCGNCGADMRKGKERKNVED